MAQRVVVIGGGAAGMSAASAARRTDPGLEVVVLEAMGYAAYGMCRLPRYLSGHGAQAADLGAYRPECFREQRGLDVRYHARVDELDAAARLVRFSQGGRRHDVSYDRLIVATGGVPVMPPVPGLDDERVFTMWTLGDAKAVRSLLDAGRIGRALVVGADYIGLEVAEAFLARGVDVTVVEALPRVMPNFDEPMAARVEHEVRRHGVDLHLGATLQAVNGLPGGVEAVVDGQGLAVDVVVIAVGIRAASSIAAAAGAATGPGGGLVVDDRMRTNLPDVYAAGDCTAPLHRVLGRPAFVPLGAATDKTGRVAGTVAGGGDATFGGTVGTAVVRVHDVAVARTGLTLAEAEAAGVPAVATDVTGRSRAKYYPGTQPVATRLVHEEAGRILGAQMIGRDGVAERIDVVAAALHAGMNIHDLAALDLSYAPPYAPIYEPVLLAAYAAIRRQERLASFLA